MAKQYKELRLVLGDQLNHQHSWFKEGPHEEVLYTLMEIRPEQEYVRHHRSKTALFFAAMRAFAAWLKAQGHPVEYYRITNENNAHSFAGNLKQLVEQHGIERLRYQQPDEYRLEQQFKALKHELGIDVSADDTEHFLTERDFMARFFKGKKQWLMESFYRHMRQELNVLMTPNGEPEGGSWNYDKQNRNPPPKGEHVFPEPAVFDNDFSEVLADIDAAGLDVFGGTEALGRFPVTREQALQALKHFIKEALPAFGTWQDTMMLQAPYLNHSLLSSALNMKLLHPMEVVKAVQEAHYQAPKKYALNQVEGFIRQIIGWREYMRGIYWAKMPQYAETNALHAHRSLPSWYWTGKTNMQCLRTAITDSLKHGYAHHIQRLMITGNFATLAGIEPAEVNAWYLGIYVDAIEWAQLPNTHGMALYADDGLIATKPYVAGGAYVKRMSNYCQDCHYNVNAKTNAEGSKKPPCPLNSLYWHFMQRHEAKFSSNARIGKLYGSWHRMDEEKRTAYLATAEGYLAQIEEL